MLHVVVVIERQKLGLKFISIIDLKKFTKYNLKNKNSGLIVTTDWLSRSLLY